MILMLSFLTAGAQDTLILNDGSELYVHVIEVGEKTISYKKQENLNGPMYSTDISKIFMAAYKNGNRETFNKRDNDATPILPMPIEENNTKAKISNHNFEVHLVSTRTVANKKNKEVNVEADIAAYTGGRLFIKISLSTTLPKDLQSPLPATVYITTPTEKIQNFLWEKYESYSGKGCRWELPPHFFSLESSSCSIKFYTQKPGNKEILGFGGISYTVIDLKDCSSLENKLLSVALIWLQTNFGK